VCAAPGHRLIIRSGSKVTVPKIGSSLEVAEYSFDTFSIRTRAKT